MLAECRNLAEVAKEASVRKRRRGSPSDEAKVVHAEQLASLGELSAARRALEGAVMAPDTLDTLAELTNPVRRPPRPRDPVPVEILENLLRLSSWMTIFLQRTFESHDEVPPLGRRA